jgi:hypothetical protein
VLQALDKNQITACLTSLRLSFPKHQSFTLFRTIVFQYVWAKACQNQLGDAARVIDFLGEPPLEHFREM